MSDQCRELEQLLHRDIPLTQAMQVQVLSWQDAELRLQLPLAANCNLHQTMFGGSLYCAAVLAGWGWLYLRLREAGIDNANIVIREGQISYLQPQTDDAMACCPPPAADDWDKFLAIYQRRGVARLSLQSQVLNAAGAVAAQFAGQYVLQRERS